MQVIKGTGLTRNAVARVLVSLIHAEQSRLVKQGTIPRAAGIDRHVLDHDLDGLTDLPISEAGLGFDSLARLELVLQVNRFFDLSSTGVEDYLVVRDSFGEWVELIATHLDLLRGDAALTFSTSGSAGPPKHITHPVAHLLEEVEALATGPFAASPARILSLVPARHIYGFLFTCLLPTRMGLPILDHSFGAPDAVFKQAQPGDLIIATPFIWAHLGRSGQRFRKDVRGVTSGGPSDAATWAICGMAQLDSLTEVYGATETGGIGLRLQAEDPFMLLSHLRNDTDQIIRNGDKTPLDLQDDLEWQTPNSFHVMGRNDDVIQIGGVNVSPRHVEDVLNNLPDVSEAAVRVNAGELSAFVVPRADDETTKDAIRRSITAQLDPAGRPKALLFGLAIPRDAMGKRADWQAGAVKT